MKILVPVKRVLDAYVKARVLPDNSGIDLNNVKMSMNPFCEIAIEEAARLKEAGHADEVIAVSIGPKQSQETLRTALAMGADRAILIESDTDLEALNIAKTLVKVVSDEQPDLVILGKQSIDSDNNQTGQMLAALLGWPQACFASAVEKTETGFNVTREVDGGLETLALTLPAVVTTDLRLNEPRYASLPNIMKAKKKPLETKNVADYGVDLSPRVTVLEVAEPAKRAVGEMVADVATLVDKLQNEAKVI